MITVDISTIKNRQIRRAPGNVRIMWRGMQGTNNSKEYKYEQR